MQALCVEDVIEFLAGLAPLELAEEWDNVGLLLGGRDEPVQRVMTCLSVTPPVVGEAIDEGVSLVVSHHPILFRPVHRIVADDVQGRMVLDLVRAGIAVYSPHTAYDSAASGINQQLAELLGLEKITALRPLREAIAHCSGAGVRPAANDAPASHEYKLVVFVPEDSFERLVRALFDAGAGRIGEYSECSFRTAGTGTFFGSESSHPTIGETGRREEVAENRLEVVCPAEQLTAIVSALRSAHPYEEPAFDVYPLIRPVAAGAADAGRELRPNGSGRCGMLPAGVTAAALAEQLKEALRAEQVGLAGNPDATLGSVAVACGSGGGLLGEAARLGCDAFVTGEANFHTLLEAQSRGITILLPGHYATERFGVETLAAQLSEHFPGLRIHASHRETDPLVWQ